MHLLYCANVILVRVNGLVIGQIGRCVSLVAMFFSTSIRNYLFKHDTFLVGFVVSRLFFLSVFVRMLFLNYGVSMNE